MHRVGMALLAMLMATTASAQTAASPQPASQPNAPQAAAANPATTPDPAHQMQLDLNQMESLLNNMAAQVSFVRDTNMSILLNTNVQLWSVLIRDLRLQIQQQQQHAAAPQKSSSPTPKASSPQRD